MFCPSGPGLGDVCIFGLGMRVAPCRVLAHHFLRCRLSAEPTLNTCPVLRRVNGSDLRDEGPELPEPVTDLVRHDSDAVAAQRLACAHIGR
jgi:hypothetical protein